MWSSTLGGIAALALFCGIGFLMIPKRLPPPVEVRGGDDPDTVRLRESSQELARILGGMDPTRLQITTEPDTLTHELNSWFAEFGPKPGAPGLAQDADLIQQKLTGDTQRRALQKNFSVEDASYIRESLLAQQIVESVASRLATDGERALALFDFTVHQMSLIQDNSLDPLPLSPHECLLFNIGTRDDRIWTFAALLRQLRLDAVVLTSQADGMSGNPLVGVLTSREGVLLFDPRLGLPIPGPGDDANAPEITQAASLEQVLENDAPFRKLDFNAGRYPLSSEAMKKLRVEVIGVSSSWAPRFAELQFRLPPGMDMVLHDGLGKSDARPQGQWERVAAAGQGKFWTKDSLGVWRYPERGLSLIAGLKGAPDKRFEDLLAIFRGPTHLRKLKDASKPPIEAPADRSLREVRIEQLTGKYAEAVRDYVAIRTMALTIPKETNLAAVRYAAVWTGVSQFKRGESTAAISTLARFMETYPGDAALTRWAGEWQALALAKMNKRSEAAAVLQKIPASYTPRTDAFLIHRWTGKDITVRPNRGVAPDAEKKPTSPAEPPENPSSAAPPSPALPQQM